MDNETVCKINILSNTEVRTLIEDAPVMLWCTDDSGNIIYNNVRWREFIGLDRIEEFGDDVWIHALHPDEKDE